MNTSTAIAFLLLSVAAATDASVSFGVSIEDDARETSGAKISPFEAPTPNLDYNHLHSSMAMSLADLDLSHQQIIDLKRLPSLLHRRRVASTAGDTCSEEVLTLGEDAGIVAAIEATDCPAPSSSSTDTTATVTIDWSKCVGTDKVRVACTAAGGRPETSPILRVKCTHRKRWDYSAEFVLTYFEAIGFSDCNGQSCPVGYEPMEIVEAETDLIPVVVEYLEGVLKDAGLDEQVTIECESDSGSGNPASALVLNPTIFVGAVVMFVANLLF